MQQVISQLITTTHIHDYDSYIKENFPKGLFLGGEGNLYDSHAKLDKSAKHMNRKGGGRW